MNESNSLKLKRNISVEEEKNETEEIRVPEIVENKMKENVTETIIEENHTGIITENNSESETNSSLTEVLPLENPETNLTENTEQVPKFGITGQIVSQPQSQGSFFNQIKRFTGKIIRDIRESFN